MIAPTLQKAWMITQRVEIQGFHGKNNPP